VDVLVVLPHELLVVVVEVSPNPNRLKPVL
jgi:hypothetical protein